MFPLSTKCQAGSHETTPTQNMYHKFHTPRMQEDVVPKHLNVMLDRSLAFFCFRVQTTLGKGGLRTLPPRLFGLVG